MLDLFKQDIDFGTPASTATETVTLHIDGQAVTVPKGTSLMRAAVDAGVRVPKLCATDSLEPFGSCRLCLVEIEGRKGYQPRAPRQPKPAWSCTRKRPNCRTCARV